VGKYAPDKQVALAYPRPTSGTPEIKTLTSETPREDDVRACAPSKTLFQRDKTEKNAASELRQTHVDHTDLQNCFGNTDPARDDDSSKTGCSTAPCL